MFESPSASTSAMPRSTCTGDKSTPTNSESGRLAAIGMRLPPDEHPTSSTRHRSTGAASTPKSQAIVESRSGCDCGNGKLWYGKLS